MPGTSVVKIYTDGGARGNPGPAASAFVVIDAGKVIKKGAKYLGETTNNQAEYQAVLLALQWLENNLSGVENVEFNIDSLLVVKQLNGEYKIKNNTLRDYYKKVKNLEGIIEKNITYTFVRREKNVLADELVNRTLDENYR